MANGSTVVLGLVMLGSIIGNVLVILSAIFNRKLRNYTDALIINLAISDLLITTLSLPLRILRLSNLLPETTVSSYRFCKFTTCLTITLFAASNYNLLLLTLDRYCAIRHALFYKFNFRRRYMVCLITTAWLLACAVGVIPVFVKDFQAEKSTSDQACTYASVISSGYTIFTDVFTYFAPSAIMFAQYALIIRKVHKSFARNSAMAKSTQRIRSSLTPQAIRRKERRLAMGVLFLLGAHTICMAPICLLDFAQLIGKMSAPLPAIEVCLFLTYLNPALNAPTYAAASREYYSTFTSLLCCFGKAQRVCKECVKLRSGRTDFSNSKHIKVYKAGKDIWFIDGI